MALGISSRLIWYLDQCPGVQMDLLLSEYKGLESMSIGLWSYMSDKCRRRLMGIPLSLSGDRLLSRAD
jgi:hypothetical protein